MRRKLFVFLISLGLLVGAATPAFGHSLVCPNGTERSQELANGALLVAGHATANAAGAPIVLHGASC